MNAEISETIKTAENCGFYSFDARIKIVTEKYCSYQYLYAHFNFFGSIDRY